MKVQLNVDLKEENGIWNLFLEKELKMDFLPDKDDEIEDNGVHFKIEYRTFNLGGSVSLMLEHTDKLKEARDIQDVLNRMYDSGWTYRGDPSVDIRKMGKTN